MACSRKGQMALSCQLCEECSKTPWKCLQCDSLLCDKCKTIHEKVKSTDQHTIIDIKDFADYQHQDPTPDFRNIPCKVHHGKTCCLFCKTCDESVCPICITKTHFGEHQFIEIEEGYKLSIVKISKLRSKLEKEKMMHAKDVATLHSLMSEENSKYEMEKEKILKHDNVLKDAVQRCTDKHVNELDKRWQNLESSISAEKSKALKVSENLESRYNNLTEALQLQNAIEIFDIVKTVKIDTKLETLPINLKFNSLSKFDAEKLTRESIELIHENLRYIEKCQTKIEFQVVQKFTTKLGLVESLVYCDHGCILISQYNKERLYKINLISGTFQHSHKILTSVLNMAQLPSGDLLLSTLESSLQILSKSTNEISRTKINIAPLVTTAVHVTKDQKVIIGTREEGPTFPANGPRQVVVMDMKGKREQIYEQGRNGKPLFSYPRIIASDSKTFYVINRTASDATGELVALQRSSSDMNWIYSGQHASQVHPFTPCGLLVTPSNNILVTDDGNHMIHILDTSGKLMKLLNTKNYGIELPFSIDTFNKGHLFIGCNTYNNSHDNAKLFMVKFSGF